MSGYRKLVRAFPASLFPLAGIILPALALSLILPPPPSASADPAGGPVMTAQSPTPAQRLQVQESHKHLPLYFIANRGQVNKRVKFYAPGGGQTTWFTTEGVVVSLTRPLDSPDPSKLRQRPGPAARSAGPKFKTTVVGLRPVGWRKGVKLTALEPQEHKVNYFIGNDPSRWHTDIPTYKAVAYREAYKGIDLKFYGDGRQLEYDIVVKPGADPHQVKFQYAGAQGLEVTPAGDLAIKLPDGGTLVQKKPMVYQEIAGTRVAREGKFKLHGGVAGHTYGFEVAAYDKKAPLVIDPVIIYSTYLGGSTDALGLNANQVAYAVQVDSNGCAYLLGVTDATNFPEVQNYCLPSQQGPVPGLTDTGGPASVCFVTKSNAAGTGLLYSTYLGASGDGIEMSNSNGNRMGLAVDGSGYAYIAGYTGSTSFPTTAGAAYPSWWSNKNTGSSEAFVTKLSTTGNSLVYSTYMRGNDNDLAHAIAVDTQGNAYITGRTMSGSGSSVSFNGVSFPQYYNGWGIAFLTKLNNLGSQFTWTQGLVVFNGGGSEGFGIVAEPINTSHSFSGGAWITGVTNDSLFPTLNPVQASRSGAGDNAFVTWFDSNGTMRFSTFWGATETSGEGIARDANGGIYVCGWTNSSNYTTKNAYQPATGQSNGGNQAILFKLRNLWLLIGETYYYQNPQVLYSTYLGGNGTGDAAYAVAADGFGNAYITGLTGAGNFPLKNPIYKQQDTGGNLYVAKLGFNGSKMSLIYSTFLGYSAAGPDQGGFGIALDGKGNAFVTGSATAGLPLVHAYQTTLAGGQDAFLTKISDGLKGMGALEWFLLQ